MSHCGAPDNEDRYCRKKKRWGGLYPPHQRISKTIFAVKANANREQNLPSSLEQLCRDAALLIQKKKRPANSTPSAVALLDFKPLIIYIQTIKSSYQPKTIQADEVLSKYSIPHSPLDFIPLIYIQTLK